MATAADNHFFEGTEKLLEVWFSSKENENADLRVIDRETWETMLDKVNCQVLSVKQDDDMVAYLLSESSMFVSKNRVILKTCGSTTLLEAVKPMLRIVKGKVNMDVVDDIFYSRKKFERPELQPDIHRTFAQEVEILDKEFKNGAAYALGRINSDCWYLYTIDVVGVLQPDQTLELIMQDLDQGVMKIFTKEVSASAEEATKNSGIIDILPGTVIDDYLFDPCGYSMNGLLKKGQYFTIHITPEPHCSYVSFETNVPQESYHDLIVRVLNIFKPGKFLMTLFANKTSKALEDHKKLQLDPFLYIGYNRLDHQFCQFKNYNLSYAHYIRPLALPPVPPPH